MAIEEREVFRDTLLEKRIISTAEDVDLEKESVELSKEEKGDITGAWDAAGQLSVQQIEELEKEIIVAEQSDSKSADGSGKAVESGFEDERDDGSQLYIRGWEFPRDLKGLEQEFMKDYESYVLTHDSEIEQMLEKKMIELLNQLCTYKIYLTIRYHYAYSWGEEVRIANDSHERVVNNLRNRKARNDCLPTGLDALRYYRKIYLYKTMDYFRDWKENHDKMLPIPSEEEIQEHPKMYRGFTENIKLRSIPKRSAEHHAQVHELLMLYIRELMDYNREPYMALAAMYARLLYQVEALLDEDTIIRRIENVMRKEGWSLDPKDKKYEEHWASARKEADKHPAGASPAWAIKRMGSRTMEALENDSEWSLQRNVDKNLAWGNSMRAKLKEVAQPYAPACWGEIVYTECFTQKDIQAWSDSVHKTISDRMARTISRDRRYRQYAHNVLTEKCPLMRIVAEETNKRRKRARK